MGGVVLLALIIVFVALYGAGNLFRGALLSQKTMISRPTLTPTAIKTFLISARIVDENGNAIPGATVKPVFILQLSGKTYRYGVVEKQTDSNGNFFLTESEFINIMNSKGVNPQKPYPFYLVVVKPGYLDSYIFESGEIPKNISDSAWNITGILKKLPGRLTKTQSIFTVSYYPGQEKCAEIALNKMSSFYPKIASLFGFQANGTSTKFVFNTAPEQGYGDWVAGSTGVATVCLPHTDNIELPDIEAMWNDAIPHELGHAFLHDEQLWLPKWGSEGAAQYVSRKLEDPAFTCDPATFLPVQELTGENMPYYATASCFWKLLEDAHPGFFINSMDYLRELNYPNIFTTQDFIRGVLVPVLVNDYGLGDIEALNYLNEFMQQFHYDPNKA